LKILGRARRFFQELGPEPAAKVQYFNVICASGHRVRGERTEGYQALRCPACGEGVFVLPRSPLPEPVAPARASTPKAAELGDRWVEEGPVELTDPARVSVEAVDGDASRIDAEIIWDDAPVETPRPARQNHVRGRMGPEDVQIAGPPDAASADEAMRAASAPGPGTSERRPKRPGQEDRAGPRDRVSDERGATIPARGEGPPRTRQPAAVPTRPRHPEAEPAPAVLERKPGARKRALHRWLLVVVPLVVIATVAWRYRRHRMEEYPLIAEKGRTEGIAALEEGNFDKAYQLLSAAKSAVDALGGAVEGADKIRNAAYEAAIFNNLLNETPEELLAEAGRTDPLSWATRFDTLYKGRTIFIDTWIAAEPESDGSGGYDLWYRILPPGEASKFREGGESRPDRVGVIDLTGFQLFELAHPRAGSRVTFGAYLAGFEYDAKRGERGEWVIRLEPKTGVFITHTKALETIGWQSGPEVGESEEGKP